MDLIEEFLGKVNDAHESAKGKDSALSGYLDTWIPGKDYYRMDGSTPADTRKIWCKFFNRATSHRMRLFLISTKAGGLGINLVAANRVIIFDASWNPSHDVQSIFRVFRFGQTKPVYVYRFLAKGTMEEKIYDRQVTKQSLAARVVDEHQIESHFTMNELAGEFPAPLGNLQSLFSLFSLMEEIHASSINPFTSQSCTSSMTSQCLQDRLLLCPKIGKVSLLRRTTNIKPLSQVAG